MTENEIKTITQKKDEMLFKDDMPKAKEIEKKEVKDEPMDEPMDEIKKQSELDIQNNPKDVYTMSKYLFNNELFPESVKSSQQVFVALQTAKALGCKSYGDVVLAIKHMYFIKGQVHFFGDLPLSIVQQSGQLESIEEYFIDEKYQRICLANQNLTAPILSAVCIIKRKGQDTKEFTLTREDLKISGGVQGKDGEWHFKKKDGESITWKRYPKIHWTRRLRGYALKFVFPDILKGVGIDEYDRPKEREAEREDTEVKAVHKAIKEAYAVNTNIKKLKVKDEQSKV